jgi:hypothetical protein
MHLPAAQGLKSAIAMRVVITRTISLAQPGKIKVGEDTEIGGARKIVLLRFRKACDNTPSYRTEYDSERQCPRTQQNWNVINGGKGLTQAHNIDLSQSQPQKKVHSKNPARIAA